ncbi:hypothetical protein [Antrihabitans spumae]|uniref:Uncharacterized protein n=1 Tax=Antrihabitans spumae TaxID=3373370 RepID=A0ABW7KBB9_9NOCA
MGHLSEAIQGRSAVTTGRLRASLHDLDQTCRTQVRERSRCRLSHTTERLRHTALCDVSRPAFFPASLGYSKEGDQISVSDVRPAERSGVPQALGVVEDFAHQFPGHSSETARFQD